MNRSARGASIGCLLAVMCFFGSVPLWAQAQVLNDQSPAVGDQPDNPGLIDPSLSPRLDQPSIQAAMKVVADWQSQRVGSIPSRDWTFATLYLGMLAASETMHVPAYADQVSDVATHYQWALGPRLEHADDQAIGQVYLALYRKNPSPDMIAPLQSQFDHLRSRESLEEQIPWWWCDALFMAPPVWAGLTQVTGDPKYIDYMDREWHKTDARLWNSREHLYSRDLAYVSKFERNGRKVFWSRGNGWVMGGIVGVLKMMPEHDRRRAFYTQRLMQMAEKVADIQGSDGLWRAGLLDARAYPRPEVSGSALFLYAIAWGVREHILSADRYIPVLQRGWAGMLHHIYVDGPYESRCQGKILSPSPPKGDWMWRFASSPMSDLERLWVRDVLQTDQGSRRFLLDGFMTRWFDAFGSGSCASKRGGFDNRANHGPI